MVTALDRRRLAEGERAAALADPTTPDEIQRQIDQLGDAIASLQSIDDAGSPEADRAAWADAERLSKRIDELRVMKASGRLPPPREMVPIEIDFDGPPPKSGTFAAIVYAMYQGRREHFEPGYDRPEPLAAGW